MNEFMELLAEALEREGNIEATDEFRKYEEWDSLAALTLLAVINERYEVTIPRVDFDKIYSVNELYCVVTKLSK